MLALQRPRLGRLRRRQMPNYRWKPIHLRNAGNRREGSENIMNLYRSDRIVIGLLLIVGRLRRRQRLDH